MPSIRTWGCVSLLSFSALGLWAADEPAPPKTRDVFKKDLAGNEEVEKIIQTFGGRGAVGDDSEPTPADKAVKEFASTENLQMDLVMAEPQVRQPLYMSFDDRGRMWVVQYLQYPFPEGLKVIKYDQYLRAVFDKVPAAPPNHVKGADRITVYEDTDADGKYDSSKDVITGLNIATAVLQGGGGIWVLNPPYLLFYPDANRDDVPDGDPVVHLSGFGLEDTHSVANSLCWGPDGWLYGANGSTTTANISSEVTKNVKFLGQCIWRYHPVTKVFEIYAEGGGNTFSLDIDGAGRVFSGTNGGGTRGMYYPQGSYGIKGWAKHGPLTNPYAFGWFEHMRHEGDGDRFPQTFAIYEGGLLPPKFNRMVISANALHNRVWASELMADSSTYRTKDLPPIVTTNDHWFRPVDLKVGPDGAVYMADWYDSRLSHVDPRDNWHKASGRIYRLSGKNSEPGLSPQGKPWTATDFTKLDDKTLKGLLAHTNKWVRFTAVRTLCERSTLTPSPSPGGRGEPEALRAGLIATAKSNGPGALESLWIVYRTGGFTPELALELLGSPSEDIRRWTVRLIGDDRRIDEALAARMTKLASEESYVQVRSQLASTAKRLPAKYGLPIVQALLQRDEDASDLHMPLLLWWAIEAQCGGDREAVLALFGDKALWDHPITAKTIVPRLMQRYALTGKPEDLETCAQLLAIAPSDAHKQTLISGFLEAYQGREIKQLPESLTQAITAYQKLLGQDDLVLNIRLGKQEAIDQALKFIADEGADRPKRLSYIAVLGEVKASKVSPVLINLLGAPSIAIKRAALQSLINFDDPAIGDAICSRYHTSLPDEQDLRSIAHRVLASRAAWAKKLLAEVAAFRIKAGVIPLDIVQQMRLHEDAELQAMLNKLWGKTRATSEEKQQQVARLRTALVAQRGKTVDTEQMTRGRALFTKHCATCHTLFDEGGQTGPNLTGYERDNIDFLLLSVVDPSAAIREEFTQFQIVTTSGLTLTGLIDKQDDRTVSIRGANNQSTLINRDEVEVLKALDTSIMPDGLVEKLSDAELADLFAYVMTRTPPKKAQ
jgi:putative membrane-bound dehydrogenase-like protein